MALDATTTVQLDYALPPQAATQLQTGAYQIVAVFEVPAGLSLPAEHWRGRVISRPVTVNITAAPAQPTTANQASTNLQRAEFFASTSDWNNALQAAQTALAANPQLIRAHIVVGEAKEALGDLSGARDAFVTARQLFGQQHPNSSEAPEYLDVKINELNQRLGIR